MVIPSLPGYGFSGKPTATGWDPHPHRASLGRADAAPRLLRATWPRAATGATRSPSRWRSRRLRDCSAFTPTCRPPFQTRSRRRSRPAGRRQPGLGGRRAARLRAARHLLQEGPGLRQRDGAPAADAVRDRGFARSGWRPGCSTTTRPATRSSRAIFDGRSAVRRADPGRHPRQHHAVLADEHRASRRRASTGRASWCSSPRRASRSRRR